MMAKNNEHIQWSTKRCCLVCAHPHRMCKIINEAKWVCNAIFEQSIIDWDFSLLLLPVLLLYCFRCNSTQLSSTHRTNRLLGFFLRFFRNGTFYYVYPAIGDRDLSNDRPTVKSKIDTVKRILRPIKVIVNPRIPVGLFKQPKDQEIDKYANRGIHDKRAANKTHLEYKF